MLADFHTCFDHKHSCSQIFIHVFTTDFHTCELFLSLATYNMYACAYHSFLRAPCTCAHAYMYAYPYVLAMYNMYTYMHITLFYVCRVHVHIHICIQMYITLFYHTRIHMHITLFYTCHVLINIHTHTRTRTYTYAYHSFLCLLGGFVGSIRLAEEAKTDQVRYI